MLDLTDLARNFFDMLITKKRVSMMFLDIRKAFGKLSHLTLIIKLKSLLKSFRAYFEMSLYIALGSKSISAFA